MPRVAALYRYPVKGLSGERLAAVDLAPGATFPADRAFALENGPSGFDPAAPAWQPKIKFLCLMRNAKIAALTTRYDDASGTFTAAKDGRPLIEARLSDSAGRAAIERFFQDFMGADARGQIRLLEAPDHSFSDVAKKVVSIINLASVAALEQSIKRKIHPLRFRGNVYVQGLPAWAEIEFVGRTIEIGPVRLRVVKVIQRCAATEVDPETAARDIDVPDALYRLTGKDDCGIYAEVVSPGRVAADDPFVVID
ncbi:MAG: MOSC domain-containing protein [Xanthobacteraceae bacterium]